jgi:hypothetical protein
MLINAYSLYVIAILVLFVPHFYAFSLLEHFQLSISCKLEAIKKDMGTKNEMLMLLS